MISLDRIDVLLNFWWFHSPHGNPLAGHYRPPGLRIFSWFLDAIPLRVAHWQPGMIPVPEFRSGLQMHLELLMKLRHLAFCSQDVITFFPHIRSRFTWFLAASSKAILIYPGADYVFRSLTLDLNIPLFTIIEFQEPSKNVPNALRALIKRCHHRNRDPDFYYWLW